MKLIKWGKNKSHDDYSRLESLLENSLQPVEPRQDFVRRLRYRIASQYGPIRVEVNEQKQRTVLLVGATLVGSILTLLMGIRIVMTLIAAMALLLQWKRQLPPERVLAVRRVK